MDVKVCRNCKRLFNYIYGPELCPECARLFQESEDGKNSSNESVDPSLKLMLNEDKAKFEQIRDYIMVHPKATVAEISDLFDIAPARLFEWIRGERLEFSDDSSYAWFTCEKCGAKIKSGRLCSRCKSKN